MRIKLQIDNKPFSMKRQRAATRSRGQGAGSRGK
jgi:hypothetical protein